MAVLTPAQRNALEKAVIQARKLAEAGAQNALQAMAVNEAEPFKHQTPQQRSLRNRLRTKGRLLGDDLPASGKQAINHLAYELSYEYWHKMLFAQFLEANGLLIHPQGVAVTMEECEELAKEEAYTNKWAAAATYASKMLPAIFRVEDPLMQVEFAPNDRIALETILENLDHTIYKADDALGWVYQFWQSEEKKRINDSGDKIDGEKLPAVTQLFTEPYMVHFLIDNTIGAWWVGNHPGETPPVKFDYLRLLDDGTPAAGKFEGWPRTTQEITALDPCMGSGHFVVSLFAVFVRLRIFEEGLSKEDITDLVIEQNLFGLELDPRCTQLAAFNLAFAAWKFCGHYKQLPEMHLACSGTAPKGKKGDWVKLVRNEKDIAQKTRLEGGMRMLFDHFQMAPELGSLLDPSNIKADAFTASFEELQPVLSKALENEVDSDQVERGVMAAGITKAAIMLSKRYSVIITNFPFLGRGHFSDQFLVFSERIFSNSKNDLATIFVERAFKLLMPGGTSSFVSPQNWMFSKSYLQFRKGLLSKFSFRLIVRLATGAFETISGEVVNVGLFSISNHKPKNSQNVFVLDVSNENKIAQKIEALLKSSPTVIPQITQLNNPDSRITLLVSALGDTLSNYLFSYEGSSTGDKDHFLRNFWEVHRIGNAYEYFQYSPDNNEDMFTGNTGIVLWEAGRGELAMSPAARIQGINAMRKSGILIGRVGAIKIGAYSGAFFDKSCVALIPKEPIELMPLLAFTNSNDFVRTAKSMDPRLSLATSVFEKLPYDSAYWRKVSQEKYPTGPPRPYTNNSTQWLFHGHPLKTDTALQTAVARLLGYRWPAENDNKMELSAEARHLIIGIKSFDHLSDEDGVVCIPSVNGEPAAAGALRNYVKEVWGSEWRNQTIEELLQKEGSTKTNLEDWLREEFFGQHCKVFQNRPFIWHIWDGRKDGFGALVNYHKLTKENLQKLIYTYLGDWIRQCESRLKAGQSGADGQLSAAKKLKEKLELILQGEAPYDIFVRWKRLQEQPIGWDPDMNDGVRLNIRPFITADVLRKKPNIKWGIDRGKNPPGNPCGEIRDNDKHLTLEEKRVARASNVKAKK